VSELVTRPIRRDAGLDLQPLAPPAESEDCLQTNAVEPTGRALVPRPAASACVGWRSVYVRRHHVGLHLVARDPFGAGGMADWVEQGEQLQRPLAPAQQ